MWLWPPTYRYVVVCSVSGVRVDDGEPLPTIEEAAWEADALVDDAADFHPLDTVHILGG